MDFQGLEVSTVIFFKIVTGENNAHFNEPIDFLLCYYCIEGVLESDEAGLSYASLTCPALIMSILQYCPDCKQHAQFVETLMRYKRDVCLDILAVLAYGPQPIINSAGQVLLHYYPLKDVGKANKCKFKQERWIRVAWLGLLGFPVFYEVNNY